MGASLALSVFGCSDPPVQAGQGGGTSECPAFRQPPYVLAVRAQGDAALPADLFIEIAWSGAPGGKEPKVVGSAPETHGSHDRGDNVVCDIAPSLWQCELWIAGPFSLRAEVTGFEPYDNTFTPAAPSEELEECENQPSTEVEALLVKLDEPA